MSGIEISIVIATKNRPLILSISVWKALSASKGLPVEIIIVNDGDPLLIDFNDNMNIRVFHNPSNGVTSARNYGVEQSRGKTLFIIDDDMWINQLGLIWILENFKKEENQKVVFNLNWEYPIELQKNLLNSKIGMYILASNYNTMWGRMHIAGAQPSSGLYKFSHIASCSLVMSRDIFNRIGGYNEDLIFQGEDIELSNRINNCQIPIYCVFDVTLFHNHSDRLDLNGYLDRESRGFQSQFAAEISGTIAKSTNNYQGIRQFLFRFAEFNEKLLIFIIDLTPSNKIFIKPTNTLIGILSSLQRYKQWRKVFDRV